MSRDAPQEGCATLGLVGFGAFARLTAAHLRPFFALKAWDPAMDEAAAAALGVETASLEMVAASDVVVLAAPVERLREAALAVAPHLAPGALVLDVGSVKVLPAAILQEALPPGVDIVCTHPLFGPQSAKDGLKGLKVALCPIRGTRAPAVRAFLEGLGLEVIVTTPEDHDREAAMVQGLTHLIAKVLVAMEPLPTRMTTVSFELIMRAVEMVRYDAPEVFMAIERDNPFAHDVRERFFALAEALKTRLDVDGEKNVSALTEA